MDDKFYAVWRKTGGAPPQKRHDTHADAVAEAMRLARQTLEDYYILEVVGIVRLSHPPIEYIEIK